MVGGEVDGRKILELNVHGSFPDMHCMRVKELAVYDLVWTRKRGSV